MTKMNAGKQLAIGAIAFVILFAAYKAVFGAPDAPVDLHDRISKTEDYMVPNLAGKEIKRLHVYWSDDAWNTADENTLRIAAGDAIEIAQGIRESFPGYQQLEVFVQIDSGVTYRKLLYTDIEALARLDGAVNSKRKALELASVIN
ncbi:hypothetical protein [Thalassospira marina]|uniref:Uncharacterized protein n=1 Tax=Thalassospira marina TaxID=2048283 RepID=A0A2N3KSG8_9PROT|nr:hypothetical protein [Thalassospira marina]PKR53529.1 hypothetical protein COO20_13395 [Thalassospira marina]